MSDSQKVYCKFCDWFDHNGPGGMCYNPSNVSGNWYAPDVLENAPGDINQNNDCPGYESTSSITDGGL